MVKCSPTLDLILENFSYSYPSIAYRGHKIGTDLLKSGSLILFHGNLGTRNGNTFFKQWYYATSFTKKQNHKGRRFSLVALNLWQQEKVKRAVQVASFRRCFSLFRLSKKTEYSADLKNQDERNKT